MSNHNRLKRIPVGALVQYSKTYMTRWGCSYRKDEIGMVVEHANRYNPEDPWYSVKWIQIGGPIEGYLTRDDLKYFRGKR